jgi:hypothetical protein
MARLFQQTIDNNPNNEDRLAFERAGQVTRNITFTNFLAWLRGVFTASESQVGGAEIATQTEVNTGTDDTRIVTAAKLNGKTATESRRGVVEIATQAETTTGTDDTRTVTPLKLQQKLDAIGLGINTTVIDIGDWNMDVNLGVNIAHGLTFTDIRSVEVYIRNDNNDFVYPLNNDMNGGGQADGIHWIASANVQLSRTTGGFFDGVGFDSTGYNRGWIVIRHI